MSTSLPALVTPLLRVMWRSPVLGVAVLVAAPAMYAVLRGEHDLSFPVSLAAIVGASSVAFAVDDVAEATLTPCPTSRATRRFLRAVMIAVVMLVSWGVVAVAVRASDASAGPMRIRIPEAAAAASISAAFAARAGRHGADRPGLASLVATLLVFATVSGVALRLTWLPQVGHPLHSDRWWIVAAATASCAAWWSRDPSARLTKRSYLPIMRM